MKDGACCVKDWAANPRADGGRSNPPDEALLELRALTLLDELLGSTPELPLQTVHGHPILLPSLFMRYSKCG